MLVKFRVFSVGMLQVATRLIRGSSHDFVNAAKITSLCEVCDFCV